MSIGFFIVGGVIFSVYMYFTVWNIFYSSKKQREENYPNYYHRHGQIDNMDMDGHGNYGRFPPKEVKRTKRRIKQRKKQYV